MRIKHIEVAVWHYYNACDPFPAQSNEAHDAQDFLVDAGILAPAKRVPGHPAVLPHITMEGDRDRQLFTTTPEGRKWLLSLVGVGDSILPIDVGQRVKRSSCSWDDADEVPDIGVASTDLKRMESSYKKAFWTLLLLGVALLVLLLCRT